jgi:hypothetical protein
MLNVFFQKINKPIIFLFIILLNSCAIAVRPGDMGSKDLDYYFQTSGAVEFFLPQLPAWANASASANCHRNTAVRYLDFRTLKSSYNFSYIQLINFQHIFNVEQNELIKTFGPHAQGPSEEEKLFYKVSDKVQAGHYSFILPEFPLINLIWIDHILMKGPNIGGRMLEAIYQNPSVANGHPVWLSLCYSNQEMLQWLVNAKLDGLNAKWITSEFFAAFNQDAVPMPSLQLDITSFFGTGKKVNFFVPDLSKKPVEVIGTFNLKKIP